MSGNGVDLGVVLGAIDIVARNVNALTTRVDGLQAQVLGFNEDLRSLHGEVRGLHGEVRGLSTEVSQVRREMATKGDLALLRQTLTEYHSAVIGHGVLISELDDRLRRVEQHLGLSSAG